MPTTPSLTAEVRTLIAGLHSTDDVTREASIARLAIVGARAVDRVIGAYAGAPRETRTAVLRTLEGIGDPRALPLARGALAEGGDVAIAAAGTMRVLLHSHAGDTAAQALDALIAAALSPAVERRVRIAALDALRDTERDVRDRIEAALRSDPDAAIRGYVTASPSAASSADVVWLDALEGRLPEDPAVLREALRGRAEDAPLGVLQRLVDTIRARVTLAQESSHADGWLAAHGAVHQVLAQRGSRIALYDLRETVTDARDPLPASFAAALHAIGDESCLDAIAAAYERTDGDAARSARWREQLAAAFQAIVTRERIGRRSPVWKRLSARWPAAARSLSTPSRTTPRPKRAART